MEKIVALLIVLLMTACTTYESQYVGFRPAEEYSNRQHVAGLTLGAEAYADKDNAQKAFGFDVKKAGLLPVQLVMNNQGGKTFEVHAAQTFLKDQEGRLWTLITNQTAVERIDRATEMGAIGKGAGKGAILGAAGGAILGAAIGVVTGRNVADAAGKGAAAGGAGGAVIGGASGDQDARKRSSIAADIREKGLEGKSIPPLAIANGFLFFPAEAKTAKELRLQLRDKATGVVHNLILRF